MKSPFLITLLVIVASGAFAQVRDTLPDKAIEAGRESCTHTVQSPLVVTDIDGNLYDTVMIGTQIWMRENLRVTKYNDGTHIPLVKDPSIWANNFNGKPKAMMSWYENSQPKYMANKYGALYNWYVVNPLTNGNRSVCPIDWHVPTDDEWTTMENYLIMNAHNFDSTTHGDGMTNNKIAKSLASTTGWHFDGSVGAVGNNDYVSLRNKSGFTALPAGYRGYGGTFINITKYGYWWTSTQAGASSAWGRSICYSSGFVDSFNKNKAYGYSIRCIKN